MSSNPNSCSLMSSSKPSFCVVAAAFACALGLSGCGHTVSSVSHSENAMQDSWTEVRSTINRLEVEHATEAQWKMKSESSEVVPSVSALVDICPMCVTIKGIAQDFQRSPKVVHFGFEGGFHALVFFDATGRSGRVLRH